ncbi:MAG: iron ABC transporter permease [Polyangiaceae bacterium]|nr:iron ABC transporter permease [Myxococcales bacterium]MCB9584633.1 iron ABC transporter permease [Polyangiaceae bacterium]MCB9609070.1 iron ABC transporter permease [Polyangiaceae bacterium]
MSLGLPRGSALLLHALVCLALLGVVPFIGPSLNVPSGDFILWQLRVPRLLVGAIVGGTLGLSGAVYQALFRNGLATPSTVGTLAGATLGALAVLVLGGGSALGLPAVALAAFVGGLGLSGLVLLVAARQRASMGDVLLAGIAVTLAASALSTGLQYTADSRALFAAAQWSLGSLPQVGYRAVLWLVPFCGCSSLVLLVLARPLQSLVSGEEVAATQGVNVARVRALALGGGALGVAACVAWCGPIAFVGLLVPHLVRGLGVVSYRRLLPLSWIYGATLLVWCDLLARLVWPRGELPVGVVTAALGAPALIVVVARKRRA